MSMNAQRQAGSTGPGVRSGKLIPVDVALQRGLALVPPDPRAETVPLIAATGRVLARDIVAPFALPPFDNSAMDGYALRTADLDGDGPWRLRVVGRIACGDDPSIAPAIGDGECLRIFTGAAVPAGADAVVMQENAERTGEEVILTKRPRAGQCIRRRGEDAAGGSLLLKAGTRIGSREAAAVASVGLPEVEVFSKVRIALFCTGNELRQPGEALAAGQIYNSNRYMMLALMQCPWSEVEDWGSVPDDPRRLRETLSRAAAGADIVVTTGGVSVGDEDHMVEQVAAAGGRIDALKIAIKPGKPLAIGKLGAAIYIGLPGNPVAAYTTWAVIGARIAAACAGMTRSTTTTAVVEAAETFTRTPGREEYRPARLLPGAPGTLPKARLLDRSFSARIALFCSADGFAVIPADATGVNSGDLLSFIPI